MATYNVEFKLRGDRQTFSMQSPSSFTSQTDDEMLKEEAAAIIRTFHTHHPELEIVAPTEIKLFRENDVVPILDCDDLSDNSINRAKR